MMPLSKSLYDSLHRAYKTAHPDKPHQFCDVEVSKIWKICKLDANPQNKAQGEIRKWTEVASRKRNTLDKFWNSIPPPKANNAHETVQIIQEIPSVPPVVNLSLSASSKNSKSKAPVQEQLKLKIAGLSQDVLYLSSKHSSGITSDNQVIELKNAQSEIENLKKDMKSKEDGQRRQQKKRDQDKRNFEELAEAHPELACQLKKRQKVGRPRIEEDQPELLKAIVEIATFGAGADERRRSECLRTVRTLDDLTKELQAQGFTLKRNAVYVRLLPKRSKSNEGKRHVSTTPVRLLRATNDHHKEHSDTVFCRTTIRYLEEIASTLGPQEVLFLSQDDKARVPIGKTAATKQSPLVMHLDYRVKLPDHDWVVANQHKLIPSVYALIEIKPNRIGEPTAVGYSGPTFITIRSGKHSGTTAYSHARDLRHLLSDETTFSAFTRTIDGQCKPIIIIIVDGGPDENPRYVNVINASIGQFKKYELDAIFIATNAPGRSAFNRVERRMAPLSKELSGLVIPHDHFGNHLDKNGETVDIQLEEKNFQKAGMLLAELWSACLIDKHETLAQYVTPEDSEVIDEITFANAEWRAIHVRESHYCLQIVKCGDTSCCKPPRSSYFKILKQFIPAPVCVVQKDGLRITNNEDGANAFTSLFYRMTADDSEFRLGSKKELSFDLCCPSIKDLISDRTCQKCGIYHGTLKSLKCHAKWCKATQSGFMKRPNPPTQNRLVRPVRIAARRQREKMVIWKSRLNDEHIDWFDDEEIDLGNIILNDSEETTQIDQPEDSFPVLPLEQRMQNVWEEN